MSGIAPLLGIPDGWLPTNVAELQAYLREMLASGEITPSATAWALARDVVTPSIPGLAQLLCPLTQLSTIGLLPPPIRAMYGFP